MLAYVCSATAQPLRSLPNEAFGLGEELYYNVGYKFITAGTGAFKIAPKLVERNGIPCYDITFEVQSLKSLDWVYKLRNTYRTLVDVDGVFPWFFEQHNREGNYRRDFWAELDQRKHSAKTSDGEFAIEPFTHDVVSAFFYVRTLNLKNTKRGDVVNLKNFADKDVYDLKVRILGRQTVQTDVGTFNCVGIEPLVVEGGLFKSEGRIVIWLTDDDRKIPVKVSTKIVIGSVDAVLTGYKGLRGQITAKVEQAK